MIAPHPRAYITVSHGMGGWFAVLVIWTAEGFYDVEQTGLGRYETREEAVAEARWWAHDEKLPVRGLLCPMKRTKHPPTFHHLFKARHEPRSNAAPR